MKGDYVPFILENNIFLAFSWKSTVCTLHTVYGTVYKHNTEYCC